MKLTELSQEMQTGDIILFHQTGSISIQIEKITNGHFSHVGMVVRSADKAGQTGLHLWQSFEPEGGVVMDLLPEFLQKYKKDYKGDFSLRRLNVEASPDLWASLPAFITEMKGRGFPTIKEMLEHYNEGKLGKDSGEKNFFCSDLVADTYMNAGLLANDPPPNFYAPMNFATGKDMKLLLGASYSELIPIELD